MSEGAHDEWARTTTTVALLIGAVTVMLRFEVLAVHALTDPSASQLLASVLGYPAHVVVAIPAAALLARRDRARFIGWVVAGALLAAEILAFHYEAAFGELPASASLEELVHSPGATASILEAAPPLSLGLELVAGVALIYVGHRHAGPLRLSIAVPILIAFGASTVATHAAPHLFSGRTFWATRSPILHFALSSPTMSEMPDGTSTSQVARELQRAWGHLSPFGGDVEGFPLCAPTPRFTDREPNGRSVMMVLMENVGRAELHARVDGREVMPHLKAMGEAGLELRRFHASGTQSAQALPGLFAGVPAQTAAKILLMEPPRNLRGFPDHLARHGYRSLYMHGGDLSFENQRGFLKRIGFDQLIEYDPSHVVAPLSWGRPDGEMAEELRLWIREHREDGPYFAVLSTLSAHHPFRLPEGVRPRFGASDPEEAFLSSLHYADSVLGELYRFYAREEAPRGTLFVLVGDHAPMHETARARAAGEPMRTDTAFVLLGAEAPPGDAEERVGSHFDLPATLAGQLGLPQMRCDQGVDLLSPPELFDEGRMVHAVAGRDLRELYVHDRSGSALFSLGLGAVTLLPGNQWDEARRRDLLAFARLYPAFSYALLDDDGLAPPRPEQQVRDPVSPLAAAPLVVSHRGRVDPSAPESSDNRLSSIERALSAGFDRVEVDLQLTADDVPILHHDPTVVLEGKEHTLAELDLDALRALEGSETIPTLREALSRFGDRIHFHLEAKPQTSAERSLGLAHAIVRELRAQRERGELLPVVVDSFSFGMATSIAHSCSCAVGWDTPFGRRVTDGMIRRASEAGLRWIYVQSSRLEPDLLASAHRAGLYVLAYEVAGEESLRGVMPDAIIVDSAELLRLRGDRR